MTTAQAALAVSLIVGVFAIYGAVNSRRALDWQKQRDRERRDRRVRVHVEQWSSFGREDGLPTSGTPIEEIASLCRVGITVSVINESEAATVYVRDLEIFGAQSYEGQPLMLDDPDERLEPHQRLVRRLQIDDQDLDEYGREGFVVRARLSTGEIIDQPDRLLPEMVRISSRMVALHRARAQEVAFRANDRQEVVSIDPA